MKKVKKIVGTGAHGKGRPREFDAEKALEGALCVFWQKGYEGAGLTELTKAMGINRPSLYAAFGNKEALFRKVIDLYEVKGSRMVHEALSASTAKEAIRQLLTRSVGNCGPGKIRGCLLVQGALACGEDSDVIRMELTKRRAGIERAVLQRLEAAEQAGEFPKGLDVQALAKYVATFHNGLAVQQAGGATREELLAAVEMMMRGWPGV